MADWFVSPVVGKFMEKVIDGLFYYVQDQFKWQTGMKKELERLRDNHLKITAVVSAARRVQTRDQNSALNKWIWQLRDAIDEADDLFDDFEYMKHQEQDNWQKLIQVGERALKSDPILKRLEEVVQKLDNISADVSIFLNLFQNINQEQEKQQVELHTTRETTSLPNYDLIGRGKDKKSAIEWLRQPPNTTTGFYRNISLLSIVGHGGMGKTTLLQHVYQDEITEEFDLKMWVCVSNNFDVKQVITNMLECLQKKKPSLERLQPLHESLRSEVKSKKFLLVLDDIWDDEEGVVLFDKWGKVLAPLAYGGLGSKILITTRTDSAASMIANVIRKEKEVMKLEGLKEDECLQLLYTHAFGVGENPNDHKRLKSIAEELVKKLYGSPLAAKVMGGVLNSNLDERHWRCVLNSSLGHNDIFSILKLSYIFLPEHLQSCFSFCSIFEQDHVFDKDDLIRSWIAVGFIHPFDNNQGEALTVEDIGKRYFDVLIKKSFFDKVSTERYKMHDLLHELAQSVSTQECFRFVGDEKSMLLAIPKTIRHLSVETKNPEVLKTVGRFKNLRTLHITYEYDSNLNDALIQIVQVSRSIRLFDLHSELEVIPEEIKYLQHLRCLKFFSYNVKLLPRSLSSLYHLQFIYFYKYFLHSCPNDYFPRDMNKLSNLRYLRSDWFNFPGIGKLKFLQELDPFNIKNENDYKIEELEHMNEIRILYIANLKDVRDAQEACNAKLCDKRNLTDLSLNWDEKDISRKVRDIGDPILDEMVLNNLQPPNYLKKLHIRNYMGAMSAIWMNKAHTINNLEKIKLSGCLEWEILPPFGLLPFLKTLSLENMRKVKRLENKFHGNDMCCVFPSLEKLKFENMEELVDWFDASVVDDLFPCLIDLELSRSPKLQELPYLPPKLKKLKIYRIGWKTLNCCSISKSILLETLNVRNCPNITSISLVGEIDKLKNLIFEDLSLQYFPFLLANIPSLEILNLDGLPQLRNEYIVEALEHMNDLHTLGLGNLKDVRDAERACNAKLCDKRRLTNLSLRWGIAKREIADHDLDERVLDNLQPHNHLKTLRIHNYMGARSAIWMNESHLINNLQEIELWSCLEWEILPPFGQLPYLKSLKLCGMPKVKRFENKFHGNDMCSVFPSLENLCIWDMDALVDWFDASVVDALFPCLIDLELHNCPKLQVLPYLPPKLVSLDVINIGWKSLNFCSISKSIPLQSLRVSNCPNITSIWPSPCVFPSLWKLYFDNLEALVDWFDASVVDALFPCLTVLHLHNCPKLQELPYLPPKLESLNLKKIGWKTLNCCSISKSIPLETLDVRHCPNITSISLEGEIGKLEKLIIKELPSLESFPSSLANISSLKYLKLAKLPQLQEYPDLPPSLEKCYFI